MEYLNGGHLVADLLLDLLDKRSVTGWSATWVVHSC